MKSRDDEELRHRRKKHKHNRSDKHHHKREKRRDHDSDSEGEEQLPTLQAEPWHGMQFELIDRISGYGTAAPDSLTLRGLAPVSAPGATDMSDFVRLVSYLRTTFELHAEIPVVLCVSVRGSLGLGLASQPRLSLTQSCVCRVAGPLSHCGPDDAPRVPHELPNGRPRCGVRARRGTPC